MKIKELAEFFNRQVQSGQGEIEVLVMNEIVAEPEVMNIEDVDYQVYNVDGVNRRFLVIQPEMKE